METEAHNRMESERDWVKIENETSGKSYFWQVGSGKTCWELPPDAVEFETQVVVNKENDEGNARHVRQWEKVKDKAGNVYFWNTMTDETCWSPPTPLAEEELMERRRAESLQKAGAAAGVKVISGINGLLDFDENGEPVLLQSPQSATGSGKSRRGLFFGKDDSFSSKRDDKHSSGRSLGVAGKKGHKEPSVFERAIRRRVKESKGKMDAEKVVQGMEIGTPFGVQHNFHVRFDKDTVRYAGVPEDWDLGPQQYFGTSLNTCPRLEVPGYKERIPATLVMLWKSVIELGGLTAEGLFRIAPDGTMCEAVKQRINNGDGVASLDGITDPNVPANLVKIWFRELKPNLFNCLSQEQLGMYIALAEDLDQIGAKVFDLPEPQQSVLLWLLDLMHSVAKFQEQNRMTPKNLAIVISPNLYEFSGTPGMEAVRFSQKIAGFLENLLLWRIRENNAAEALRESEDTCSLPSHIEGEPGTDLDDSVDLDGSSFLSELRDVDIPPPPPPPPATEASSCPDEDPNSS